MSAESWINSSANGSQLTEGGRGSRRPANAEGAQLQPRAEHAPRNSSQSKPDPLPHNAGSAGNVRPVADQLPDESDRAGRHRSPETPSHGEMLDDVEKPVIDGAATRPPAAADLLPRLIPDRADRSVTGGWVPGVNERLRRGGFGRPGYDNDAKAEAEAEADADADADAEADADAKADAKAKADAEARSNGAPTVRSSDDDDNSDIGKDNNSDLGKDNNSNRYEDADEPDEPDEPDEDESDADEEEHEDDSQEPVLRDRARAVRARRVGRHWGRFAELWVPEPLRDARVDPGRRGAIVLLLVATLAAVVTALGVWRDRPEPRPVESSAIAALASSSLPSVSGSPAVVLPPADGTAVGSVRADQPGQPRSDVSAPSTTTEIVVSVTGLVDKPGIVTLSAGARVADAIAAAGGAVEGADLTGLNLAARLADGDSVVVGSSASPSDTESGVTGAGDNQGAAIKSGDQSSAGGLVNLNTADEAALDTLPGVGPVMAQNILAWREDPPRALIAYA